MTTVQFVLFENRFRVTRELRDGSGRIVRDAKMVDESALRAIGDSHMDEFIEECKIDPYHARAFKKPMQAKRGAFVGFAL